MVLSGETYYRAIANGRAETSAASATGERPWPFGYMSPLPGDDGGPFRGGAPQVGDVSGMLEPFSCRNQAIRGPTSRRLSCHLRLTGLDPRKLVVFLAGFLLTASGGTSRTRA